MDPVITSSGRPIVRGRKKAMTPVKNGVMIMAVILQNIKQAFDDVDTALLRTLKE